MCLFHGADDSSRSLNDQESSLIYPEKNAIIRDLDSMNKKIQKKEREICCLKAKLYDFITKEEEA